MLLQNTKMKTQGGYKSNKGYMAQFALQTYRPHGTHTSKAGGILYRAQLCSTYNESIVRTDRVQGLYSLGASVFTWRRGTTCIARGEGYVKH